MRKMFLLCILFMLVYPVVAQPRVDGQQRFKVLKSSPIVTNIVGWAYDSMEERWAGYYNAIWANYKKNNKTPIRLSSGDMGGCENIVSLQIKKIAYKNTIYYAMVKVYWHSGFEYPSINEGYFNMKVRQIIVYDSLEYSKFYDLNTNTTKITEYCRDGYHPVSSFTINQELQSLFNETNFKYEHGWSIYIKKEDDNTIRFSSKSNLSDKYFEMRKSVFDSLIIK